MTRFRVFKLLNIIVLAALAVCMLQVCTVAEAAPRFEGYGPGGPISAYRVGQSPLLGADSSREGVLGPTAFLALNEYETVTTVEDLEAKVSQCLNNRDELLQLRYKGDTSQFGDVLNGMLDRIFKRDDYLHYTVKRWEYGYNGYTGDVIVTFWFEYWATKQEEEYVDQKVKEILAQIITPEMNPDQREKAIHDYIVANVAYDESLNNHSAYDALAEGRVVCQGYALLAYKMLKEAGIDTRIIVGTAGGQNHAWNLVNIRGKWYHLDCTWDDPIPDVQGRVLYNYYNLTDSEIGRDHAWETADYPQCDTKYVFSDSSEEFNSPPAYVDQDILEEIKDILDIHYVAQLTEAQKQADTLAGLMEALGDPYTNYVSAQSYQAFIESGEAGMADIGVKVQQDEEGMLILSVIENSGAQEVGLMPGDIILEAGGQPLDGLDVTEAVTCIRGRSGTSIALKVKRGDKVFSAYPVRTSFHSPDVEWEWMEDGAAYIRVHTFGPDTPEGFENAVKELDQKNPLGYIIDLRGSNGDYLESVLEIAGYFVGGKTIVRVSGKDGENEYQAVPQDLLIDVPVVFLTNRYSSGLCEALVGALEEYGKAIAIGDSTFGKGSLQKSFKLSDGSLLRITTGYVYTPQGKEVQGTGVEPGLRIPDEGDLLNTAVLMLTGDAEESGSKEGYSALKFEDTLYDIDLEKARADGYWEAYQELVFQSLKEGWEFFKGTPDGWQALDDNGLIYRWYYPDYKEIPLLNNVEREKEFTITFSKDIETDGLSERIHLIDSGTGERVEIKINVTEGRKVKVTPGRPLDNGAEYYLVIQEGIKAQDGTLLKQGALCRARVRP